MRPHSRTRWVLLGAGWLVCSVLAGCMPLGYAYPNVCYTPDVVLGKIDKVYAFRADAVHESDGVEYPDTMFGKPLAPPEAEAVDSFTLEPLAISEDGLIPGQVKVAVDYGWLWHRYIMVDTAQTTHSMEVRVYRPGYHLVELRPGRSRRAINWQEARTPDQQERAVDELLLGKDFDTGNRPAAALAGPDESEHAPGPPGSLRRIRTLAPGSTSANHKSALDFAVNEYERVGGLRETTPEARTRLNNKIQALHELAKR